MHQYQTCFQAYSGWTTFQSWTKALTYVRPTAVWQVSRFLYLKTGFVWELLKFELTQIKCGKTSSASKHLSRLRSDLHVNWQNILKVLGARKCKTTPSKYQTVKAYQENTQKAFSHTLRAKTESLYAIKKRDKTMTNSITSVSGNKLHKCTASPIFENQIIYSLQVKKRTCTATTVTILGLK